MEFIYKNIYFSNIPEEIVKITVRDNEKEVFKTIWKKKLTKKPIAGLK